MNISYKLFEKSRLCVRNNNFGSNFHALYMLLQAPPTLKQKLYLNSDKFAVSFDFQILKLKKYYQPQFF